MQGTWRKARNGWVVVDVHGDEYVAENTMALLPIFEGMRLEAELVNGSSHGAEWQGLLSSMKGAGLSIVKSGEEITDELAAELEGLAGILQESEDWPSTLPGSDASPSDDVPKPERAPAAAAGDDVVDVAAAEDGYEFPAVRGPLNGRREIQCPQHGWQTAVVKDGAYRCQFKPSPRQVCTNPGAPQVEAEKRLVAL
jgi:hypothetical protein